MQDQNVTATATEPMSQLEFDKLVMDWKEASEELRHLKDLEMKLRKQIVFESGRFDNQKESGTQTYQLGGGWKLKATKEINYKIENKNGEAFTALSELAKLGEVSEFKAKDLMKFDARLSVTKYRELNEQERRIIDEILTTSPGSPQVELVPPKS